MMENKPSVSIIVPVYNVELFVADCIKSVMQQTYDGRMECIVVDDCGTDNSISIVNELIEEYRGDIVFKVLHHTKNRGLSAARNTGMDVATGDYIFFLDSDDELFPDSIANLAKPLENDCYDVVAGFVKYLTVKSPDQVFDCNGPQELNISEDILLRQPRILRTYKSLWAVVAWNRLYRAAFLHQYELRFKEGLLYEDNPWSFQIACVAESLYIVSKTTYVHKLRDGSIMDMRNCKEFARHWTTILEEMRATVDRYRVDPCEAYPYLNDAFRTVLNATPGCEKDYVDTYKNLRPLVKANLSQIIHAHRFRLWGYLRDSHYLLPERLAPLWRCRTREWFSSLAAFRFHLRRSFWLSLFPKQFIARRWKNIMGYPIDWKHPRDLNEKIQWLMVNGDTRRWTELADKVKVADYVKEKGLEHLLVPMLGCWNRVKDIDFDALPDRFVLKCNHDCSSTIVVDKNSDDYNKPAICKRLNASLRINFGDYGELHYRSIPRRILAEEYLELKEGREDISSSIIDYKVWCFGGKPYCIWCFYDRKQRSVLLDVYDLNWNYHPEHTIPSKSIKPGFGIIPKPTCLPEMLKAASILSEGFPEVRVDFYIIEDRLYFGEMTFTSGAGMMKCFTPEFLKELGDKVVIDRNKNRT